MKAGRAGPGRGDGRTPLLRPRRLLCCPGSVCRGEAVPRGARGERAVLLETPPTEVRARPLSGGGGSAARGRPPQPRDAARGRRPRPGASRAPRGADLRAAPGRSRSLPPRWAAPRRVGSSGLFMRLRLSPRAGRGQGCGGSAGGGGGSAAPGARAFRRQQCRRGGRGERDGGEGSAPGRGGVGGEETAGPPLRPLARPSCAPAPPGPSPCALSPPRPPPRPPHPPWASPPVASLAVLLGAGRPGKKIRRLFSFNPRFH